MVNNVLRMTLMAVTPRAVMMACPEVIHLKTIDKLGGQPDHDAVEHQEKQPAGENGEGQQDAA